MSKVNPVYSIYYNIQAARTNSLAGKSQGTVPPGFKKGKKWNYSGFSADRPGIV
jgi:hypothetical protein